MKKRNIFTGILFVLGAVLLVVSQIVDFAQIGFWSVFASVVLLAIMAQSAVRKAWFGFFAPPVLIYWIFKEPFDLPQISLWVLLGCAVLIAIGFHILFGSKKHWYTKEGCERRHDYEKKEDSDTNPVIDVRFSGATRYLYSEELERCEIHCRFGGAEVYFEQASLKNNTAEVILDSKFGGVELFVPKTWRVIDHVNSTMGGVSYSGKSSANENAPQLILRGTIALSGLEVHFV
jgi:predicted membrane protein